MTAEIKMSWSFSPYVLSINDSVLSEYSFCCCFIAINYCRWQGNTAHCGRYPLSSSHFPVWNVSCTNYRQDKYLQHSEAELMHLQAFKYHFKADTNMLASPLGRRKALSIASAHFLLTLIKPTWFDDSSCAVNYDVLPNRLNISLCICSHGDSHGAWVVSAVGVEKLPHCWSTGTSFCWDDAQLRSAVDAYGMCYITNNLTRASHQHKKCKCQEMLM